MKEIFIIKDCFEVHNDIMIFLVKKERKSS